MDPDPAVLERLDELIQLGLSIRFYLAGSFYTLCLILAAHWWRLITIARTQKRIW